MTVFLLGSQERLTWVAPREGQASRPIRDEKLFCSLPIDPGYCMYYPTRSEFRALARTGNLVPLYRELTADLETPVSVYLKLRGRHESFLLESVEGGERLARYSFIGAEPSRVFTVRGDQVLLRDRRFGGVQQIAPGDPLDTLRSELRKYRAVPIAGLPRFFGGAVGFLSYDMVKHFERVRPSTPASSLPLREKRESGGANDDTDAIFLLTDTLVAFDHVKHRALVIATANIEDNPDVAYDDAVQRIEDIVVLLRRPLPEASPHFASNGHEFRSNVTPAEFAEQVRRAQEHIAAGDIFQVVLSERFRLETDANPFMIYRALRRLNPSPYMFFLDFGETQFIGSSPEVLVRLENGEAQLNPIAGTRPRGTSALEDDMLEVELRSDPKERAEHVMLVDLGRNDLGRVCEYGTVRVSDFMTVERYSHVMHLVSRVTGHLRPGLDAFDLLKATFPAGTVSGAPKVRAMEIIQDLEAARRGPYAGAVGYFGFPTVANSGNMDLCITIRTIVMRGRQAFIQAGAGIVADSVPEQEHLECVNKARAMSEAIRLGESEGQEMS
jgi:anthranilate synthase component I